MNIIMEKTDAELLENVRNKERDANRFAGVVIDEATARKDIARLPSEITTPPPNDCDAASFIMSLSRRLCAASEVLGALAARDGRVAEIMRLRLALERIATGGHEWEAEMAAEALRWK